jgi:MFS family permease
MSPAALSIVMNTFHEGSERNKALGIWGGVGAPGGTVGLIAGGLITRYLGWAYIFYLNVPIRATVLALAPRIVPDISTDEGRRRFDLAGAVTGTGGLVLLVDAISQAPQYGWGSTPTIVVLIVSVAVLIGFLAIESRAKDPVLALSIFRVRTVAGANVAALLLGASWFAFVFAGSLYMQRALHYSPLQNGAAWLAGSVTSMVFTGLSQLLATRIGAKRVTAIGMTMIGASIIWATRIPVHAHFLADLAGPFVLGGAGTAFSFIPISAAALQGVGERQSGLASGLLNTSTQFGTAIGTAIASSVAASGASSLLQTGDGARVALAGGFHQTFWVLGVTALLAPPAVFTLMRGERVRKAEAAAKAPTRDALSPLPSER